MIGNQQAEDLRRCCDALESDNKRLREALSVIEEWETPLVESRGEAVSMEAAYGSNGVRDYFRGIARAALAQEGP